MKEQEEYFFEPRSLTGRKKQTRQDIKIRQHSFWDKGVKKSAQCVLRQRLSRIAMQDQDVSRVKGA